MIPQMYLQYGIAGAILLDMALEDLTDITNKRLIIKLARTSLIPVITEVVTLISQSSKSRKADYSRVRKLATRYNKYTSC